MNAALITVALAGMSFGGFTFITGTGTGAPSATPSNGGAVPVVVPQETKRDDAKTHLFEYDSYTSMYTMLNDIAVAFDMTLEMSRESGQSPMDSYLGHHNANIEGEMTFNQAIAHFEAQFSSVFMGYQLLIGDQTIQFMSEGEYQRSIVETRVYPNPSWITQTHEQVDYAGSLRELLGVKFDLGYASIQIIGDSIVVAAPPNIHTEFVQLTKDLDEVIGKRDASMKTKREQAKEQMERRRIEFKRTQEQETRESNAARKLAVGHIQAEFDRVRTELIVIKDRLRLVENELSSVDLFNPERKSSEGEFKAQVLSLRNTKEALEFEHDEIEERYFYLRSRLLKSQYVNLFKGLE